MDSTNENMCIKYSECLKQLKEIGLTGNCYRQQFHSSGINGSVLCIYNDSTVNDTQIQGRSENLCNRK